ncbi:nuclease-related domain-containing protein [Sphingomonas zeicaulis]|uniref:nuclease-related domain-containing protein n=1 Tax=Sphingomonas zeicaulis TaxID=1632740 RepID=UPI003D25F79D
MEGERESAFYLDRDFAHSDDHALIHDLRLPDGLGGFAQFDHILLSRLSRTATIFEVKHFSGRLSKNDHGEWMVWYKSSKRPIDIANPVEQVRRQSKVLERWLAEHGHDQAFNRIGCFVVVPPKCGIDRSRIKQAEPVVKADNIYREWVPFGGSSPIGRLFSAGISSGSLRAVAQQLAAAHQPGELPQLLRREPEPDVLVAEWQPAGCTSAPVPPPEPDKPIIVEIKPSAVQTDVAQDGQQAPSVPAVYSEIDPPPADVEPGAPPRKRAKAGPLAVFTPGVEHRALPDGRVALRAVKDDAVAGVRLKAACTGIAKWNPLYSNWITTPEDAERIRSILLNTTSIGD